MHEKKRPWEEKKNLLAADLISDRVKMKPWPRQSVQGFSLNALFLVGALSGYAQGSHQLAFTR